jgi:secernin
MGTAGPCTGIFKPVWIEQEVLPDLGLIPKGIYNPETLWWQHEKLHRSVLKDYSKVSLYQEERDQIASSCPWSAMNSPRDTYI